ncbi:hypothetical protein MKW98_015974 [Papaver atlanticum]|uniref:J domain-containing protein n=1 Tax=Papaver atlanticum TaxID=357466 RepID=A0AAD4RV97_9MAGN|nr:hypothetical protein MKW98_015974 [Papaver atlanticum]
MDHYQVLGLSKNASKNEIKEAFRKLALKYHPDKHSESSQRVKDGVTRKFRQISEAYAVLSDDRKRAEYNFRSTSSSYGTTGGGSRRAGAGGFSSGTYGYASGRNTYYEPPKYTAKGTFNGIKWTFSGDVNPNLIRNVGISVVFAGVLLGGSALFNIAREAIWRLNNSGKSFEETMESIEKNKRAKKDRS